MINTPRRKPLVNIITAVFFTTLVGAATISSFAPASQAQMRTLQEISIKLVVANPANNSTENAESTSNTRARRLKHAETTRLTAENIEKRLAAVGIKKFHVVTQQHGVIVVTAHSSIERDALSALLTSRGQLEIRPILQSGLDWQSIVSALPSGIELRQDIETLDAQNAYLWSEKHDTLDAFLRQLSVPATLFSVYPAENGWRSLTLGKPITTQNNLAQVQRKTTPSGVPFIVLEFHQPVIRPQNRDLALLLDGEVISKISSKYERALTRIELASPPYLLSRDAKTAWAVQVSGRLAAHLPLVVAEFKD